MKKGVSLVFAIVLMGWAWSLVPPSLLEIVPAKIEPEIISEVMITEAVKFTKTNKMDAHIAIFVNMSLPSGKNRMFVWNFDSAKVVFSTLCAHGSCDESFGDTDVVFSNVHESHCSSKGKYRIGKRGYSNWGTHFNYKLHGLEASNNNAYDRIIVLHSYEYVPDSEVYPLPLVTSWGCPMISNNALISLDKKLKKAEKPVLLWIYN